MEAASEKAKLTFYLAIIVYESSSDGADYDALYEECFTIITASSSEEAEAKALKHASMVNSYKNVYGETITWTLKQLVDVRQLLDGNEFHNGTELYARFFRNYEAYHSFDESSHPFSLNNESDVEP